MIANKDFYYSSRLGINFFFSIIGTSVELKIIGKTLHKYASIVATMKYYYNHSY